MYDVSSRFAPRPRRAGALLAAAVAALVLVGAPAALQASHYALVDMTDIIPAEHIDEFQAQGIRTTADIVEQAGTKAKRRALARKSGLTERDLTMWAHFCDLLRVDGIGPRMATLLQAAGVMDIAHLQKVSVDDLMKRVMAANAKHRVTKMPPSEVHLEGWIEQAKALPIVVK